MGENVTIRRWVFAYALGLTALTWALILAGGVVHGTGSSLACPDWPTCYGTLMPKMEGGIFYEHGHRLLASAVGLGTIILCFLVWGRGDRELRRLSLLAVLLVLFQGVLGGLTVLYRLPPAISIGHLGTSLIFFALTVWISSRVFVSSAPKGSKSIGGSDSSISLGSWILFTLFLVYLQLVLGGMVRHLGAGLACVDIPFCQGSLWPTPAPWEVKLHMLHRILGTGVALMILMLTVKVWKVSPISRLLKGLASIALILVFLQVGLGLLSIQTALELFPVTAHLGVGALLWADLVFMCFVIFQKKRGAEISPEIPSDPSLDSLRRARVSP